MLEKQQFGVKNMAFLTLIFKFIIIFAPNIAKKRGNDTSRTYAICGHRADQRSDHDAGVYATPVAIKQQGLRPIALADDGRNRAATHTIRTAIYATLPSDGCDTGGDGKPAVLCAGSMSDKYGGDEPAEARQGD